MAMYIKKISLFIWAFGIWLLAAAPAFGQTVAKAAKSILSVTTYDAEGSVLATSHGVYFGTAGEAIAPWAPFIGASSATVTDANNKSYKVTSIVGANDVYDICKFKVANPKAIALQAAENIEGVKLQACEFGAKPKTTELSIKSTEQFLEKYNYLIFNEEISDELEGCPILTPTGEVVGLVQRAKRSYDIQSTDARYCATLGSTGLGLYDATLSKTNIKIAMPDDNDRAFIYIMSVHSAMDSLLVVDICNEYQQRYPAEVEGYTVLATYEAEHGNNQRANYLMEQCEKKASDKAKAKETCDRIRGFITAPEVLERGLALQEEGDLRGALKEYNRYDSLMTQRCTDTFYYLRAKVEDQLRQYQQAMNDYAHAAVLNPEELTYLAELASLQLRVKQYEQSVRTCELCLSRTDEYADVYIVYGIALYQLERKEEAVKALERAKALGDERADLYLEKYR